MDGPVGVNSRVRGHNESQYHTDEPGICIFHLPGHTNSCANANHLSLCGNWLRKGGCWLVDITGINSYNIWDSQSVYMSRLGVLSYHNK